MRADRANEQLSAGLTCAALDRELRSILLLDASPGAFLAADGCLRKLLGAAGETLDVVWLGPAGGEDELWGSLKLTVLQGEPIVVSRPGRLTATDPAITKLVLIPDLASLSLPGQRACVVLMSSDMGVLERHGQSLAWPARYCWLAACSRERMGEVSPHLLDRFVLRLNASRTPEDGSLPDTLPALRRKAALNEAALARAIEIAGEGNSPRRDFALARVARALARRDGAGEADSNYVDRAATLLGMRLPERSASDTPTPAAEEPVAAKAAALPVGGTNEPRQTNAPALPGEEPAALPPVEEQAVAAPDAESVFAAGAVEALPYPEDTVANRREFTALRLPGGGAAAGSAGRGVIVGTQAARSLHDLAWVATLLEAAKYQRIRRTWRESASGMILSRGDLRSWRRAPVPTQSLILVLDHTALAGTNWESELTPHLRWAYVERATVTLVQVGLAAAREEDSLRAQLVQGRSLLTPAVRQGLALNPGNATPLADGLSQAARSARHILQHGRSRVRTVRLVVATDGRGNVPLEASRQAAISGPVGAAGLEDAIRCAAEAGALNYLDSYLLAPETEAYEDVAGRMAAALGANVQRLVYEGS